MNEIFSNECHSMAVNTSALRLDRLSTNRKLNYINDFAPCFSLSCFHSFDEIVSAISVKRHKYSIKWLRFAVKKPLVRVFFSPIDDASHYELMWQMKAQKEQTKHNLFSLIYLTRFDMIDPLMMPLKWLSTSFHRWMKNHWADGKPSTPIHNQSPRQSVQNIDITVKLVWINNATNVIKNAKLLVGLIRKRKKGGGRGPFPQFIQHAYGYVNMQPVCSKQHVNSLWS